MRLSVALGEGGEASTLAYNAKHRRLFGLTRWYRDHKASPGDVVAIQLNSSGGILLTYSDASRARTVVDEPLTSEEAAEEAEELLDLSGLSGTEKGKLVENRIEELLLLDGPV